MNIRSALLGLCATASLLLGCDAQQPGSSSTPAASEPDVAAATTSDLGSITKNGQTMRLTHYLVLPNKDPDQLRILFTPGALSEEDRAKVLEHHRMPFMALAFKESPNPDLWSWYPFAVAEFNFSGQPWGPAKLKHFYLMSSGVARQHDTDNLNVIADSSSVQRLAYDGENLALHMQIRQQLGADQVEWNLHIGQ